MALAQSATGAPGCKVRCRAGAGRRACAERAAQARMRSASAASASDPDSSDRGMEASRPAGTAGFRAPRLIEASDFRLEGPKRHRACWRRRRLGPKPYPRPCCQAQQRSELHLRLRSRLRDPSTESSGKTAYFLWMDEKTATFATAFLPRPQPASTLRLRQTTMAEIARRLRDVARAISIAFPKAKIEHRRSDGAQALRRAAWRSEPTARRRCAGKEVARDAVQEMRDIQGR